MSIMKSEQRVSIFRIAGIFAFAICLPTLISAQAPLVIDDLIREVSVDRHEGAFAGYSYEMEFVMRRSALFGTSKLRRKYEVILPSVLPKNRLYTHPLLLTYDSSRNIHSADISDEKRRIVKKLEQMENGEIEYPDEDDVNKNQGGYVTLRADKNTVGKQSLRIDLVELLNNAVLTEPREVTVNGRKMISVEFRPNKDVTPAADLFYLAHIEGVILIDLADRRIAAVEGFPVGKLEEMKQKPPAERELSSSFFYLQTRLPEGFWFPQKIKLDFLDAPPEFKDLEVAIEFFFSEYKRFDVQVRSVTVDAVEEAETEKVKEVATDSKPPY
ncbi:MAG: hypothetical protein OEM82_02380 [Acidobacteriota bacterium]|nr:hypothetical protein [Acidobacteriota bacterium]MDH3528058.1 hypothetical protein [Acidobacteriota bacterium]